MKSETRNSKLNKKYFGVFSIPLLKRLVPGLVLLSFVLSGILAPVSLVKDNKNIAISQNKVLAVLEAETSGGDESGGRYGSDDNVDGGNNNPVSPFNCVPPGASFIGCTVGNTIFYLIFVPANYIIYMAGWLFDITIALALSSEIINAPFARDGWVVTRDLANMFFIFILLYIAIATILEIAAYNAKALLARLIIVALLLNFSLFFTRVIIDASNILGLAFYDRISGQTTYESGSGGDKFEASSFVKGLSVTPKGISRGIVSYFDPQRLLGVTPDNAKQIAGFAGDSPGKLIFIYLFSSAIILATAWAFLSVAFLFITRTAILWFLMATAPIAFAAIILPKTREIFTKWWGELMSKSFCVAVFLFFLWLITAFVNTPFLEKYIKPQKTIGGNIATDFMTVVVLILLNFLIIFILILVAKQQTQKMCGAVAGFSMNFVSGLGTKAAGLLAGGVGGFALRNSLGAYAFKKSDEWNKAGYGGGGLRERLQLQAARKIAGASFDVKATKLGKATELGEAGGKGGYSGWIKDRTAKDVAFAKSFGVGKTADVAREAFMKNLKDMGKPSGVFGRIITGRGVLNTTQPKKAAKEVDKLLTGIEKTVREEEQLDELKAKLIDIANNPLKIKDRAGTLRDFGKIRGENSIREAIEKGELESEEAEEVIDATVKDQLDSLANKLDDAKGRFAKANRQRTPEEINNSGEKIAAEIESSTKEVSSAERRVDWGKEIKRLDERKRDRAEREASQGKT